jgi:hypothetical protein
VPSDARDSCHLRGAPTDNPSTPYFATSSRVRFNGESSGRYGGAYSPQNVRESDFRDHAPSPLSGPWSPHGSDASSDNYHGGQHGIPDDYKMSALFLTNHGFQNEDIQNEIMRVFRHIRLGWYNRQYNSFGPQKESILKSTAFSSRLLLDKFDAPSVVNWYERLTSTCEAFRIGLVPFDAIQFGRRQDGLCIPGLGFNRYREMQSTLCTALPICLTRADSRVQAMITGFKTKSCNGKDCLEPTLPLRTGIQSHQHCRQTYLGRRRRRRYQVRGGIRPVFPPQLQTG